LDDIATRWSLLQLAHRDTVTVAGPARQALVLRYSQAIRNYAGALVGDDHDADELAQDVVVRLMKGDFGQPTPERGRFRDLLKVAVKNMVRNFWSRQKRRKKRNIDVEDLATIEQRQDDLAESAWLSTWQNSVLGLAWQTLQQYQNSIPGNVSYTLLRLRADHPDVDTVNLTERLAEATGRSHRPDAVRQKLRRARLRFAQLLIEEVAASIDDPSPERVEEELADIGLIEYVRDFLPADWRQIGQLRETE